MLQHDDGGRARAVKARARMPCRPSRMTHLHDIPEPDRAVIRERRRYQSAAELARVFGTSRQAIAAICRRDQNHSPAPEAA